MKELVGPMNGYQKQFYEAERQMAKQMVAPIAILASGKWKCSVWNQVSTCACVIYE